jgi:hypothetical protein
MADGKFIEVGALNIVATPHPKGIYVELLRQVAGVEVGVWGSDYAKITTPRRRREEPDIFTGRILVWTRIDKDKRWIDKEKDEEATEDDKKDKHSKSTGTKFQIISLCVSGIKTPCRC